MGVRVRVRIEGPDGRTLETTALLNGGFETAHPHILLPLAAARKVHRSPTRGRKVGAKQADRAAVLVRLPSTVQVRVLTADREGPPIACSVLVSRHGDEVLASDSAIDALQVHIESFARGLWRFSGEEMLRDSERPVLW